MTHRYCAALAAFALGFAPTLAPANTDSLRPVVRPLTLQAMNIVEVAARGNETIGAVRPKLRTEAVTNAVEMQMQLIVAKAGFGEWVDRFRLRAQARGIRNNTLDAAFRDVQFDEDVIRRDRNQSEFSKPIWEYLGSAVSDRRVKNGKAALSKHSDTLDAIERRAGVEKEVVVAVWGLETGYGGYRGSNNIIQSMATLAYEGRRGAFFEEQLIAALEILQNGDTSARNMTGSWAGAMGHTQFMPTSYLSNAVDFNGDGRRDIWSDDPTDALASTAAYLKNAGWKTGQPWGVEVRLPRGFDYTLADRTVTRSTGAWARMGVRDTTGQEVPNHGRASILLPAGARGPALMIFDNFAALERYNSADAYVIGVGHLSDRVKGGPRIQGSWPTGDPAMSRSQREEMQLRLTLAGFDTQGVDGRVGPNTINAIRSYQRARGLVPDGYASVALLKTLQ